MSAAVPIARNAPAAGAVAAAGGGDPPDDRQNQQPGKAHRKSRPVVPLSGDEDSDSEVARARALLRRHSAAKRRIKSGKSVSSGARGGRAVRRSLRRSKGGPNYTPCLPCVRSVLRGPRGHCHQTMLPGASRCWECVTHNHTCSPVPTVALVPARHLFRAMTRPKASYRQALVDSLRATVRTLLDIDALGSSHMLAGGVAGPPEGFVGSPEPATPPDVEDRKKSTPGKGRSGARATATADQSPSEEEEEEEKEEDEEEDEEEEFLDPVTPE